jgi:predicted MFS family arabinose efflux permease
MGIAKFQCALRNVHRIFYRIPATLLFYGLVGTVVGSSIIHGYQSKLSNHDRAIHLTLLLAFLCCTAFSLFDIPIFDARINLFGWILLAALWGFASAPLNYQTQDYQTQLFDSTKGES